MSIIHNHACKRHIYQDKTYGLNNRVCNNTKSRGEGWFEVRCTVCNGIFRIGVTKKENKKNKE